MPAAVPAPTPTPAATQVAQQNPAKPKAPTPVSSVPGVGMQATNPADDLRSQTINVAPTVDRGQLAQNYINTWDSQEAPKFQADVNTAISNKAALGQLASGGLRTSVGNLTAAHANDRNAAYSKFYNDALGGSIDDAYKNVGIAQQQQAFQTGLQNQTFNQNLAGRQQENQEYNDLFNQNFATSSYNAGRQDTQFNQAVTQQQLNAQLQNQQFGQDLSTKQFNSGQQNQTFNQGLASQQLANQTQAQQFGQGTTLAQLQDYLTNSGFNRAATTYQLGTQGNPSQAYQNLSNLYGNSAQNSYGGLTNTVAGSGSGQNTNDILSLLRQSGLLGGGAAGNAIPTPTPIFSNVSDP